MLFHNPFDRSLGHVDIGSRRYRIEAGAEVEIPDQLAYVVTARGLPLVAGPSPTPGAPRATPEAPPRQRPSESVELPAEDFPAEGGESGPESAAPDDGADDDVKAVEQQLAAAAAATGRRPARRTQG